MFFFFSPVNVLLRVCQRVADPNLWLFLLPQFVLILIDPSVRQSAKRLTIQLEYGHFTVLAGSQWPFENASHPCHLSERGGHITGM